MSRGMAAGRRNLLKGSVLMAVLATLAACENADLPGFLQPRDKAAAADGAPVTRAKRGEAVERDIEAPEIFQATEAGLWDGRPSLGGVWVAHPDVKEPERVIIRSESNGKFVIGALFRRERQSPGPRLQVSSDAASALGMLAGSPTNLNVVALKREEVAPPAEEAAAEAPVLATEVPAAPSVEEGTLDPVATGAAAALDAPAASGAAPAPAMAKPLPPAAAPAPKPAPKPAAKPASGLRKPYIQIGIFSVEQNAENTATAMRQSGMVPTVKKQSASGKTFWRVLVGPAQTQSDLDTLLKKIKAEGFTDAYAVSN